MIDRVTLERLVQQGLTRKQVAEELSVGYSTVHKYMSRYGLVFLKRENRAIGYSCKDCGETNPDNFYGDRKTKCKNCFNSDCAKNLKNLKKKAVEHKGGKCSCCGYNKSVAALEFHHIDPNEKDPQWKMGWGWDRLKTEIDKCVLLCSNCHREEHERIRTEQSPDGAIG